jgi:hypothetical protein
VEVLNESIERLSRRISAGADDAEPGDPPLSKT